MVNMIIFAIGFALARVILTCPAGQVCPPCPRGYGFSVSSGCCHVCTAREGDYCGDEDCCPIGLVCGDAGTCQKAPNGKCARGMVKANQTFCNTLSTSGCEQSCCQMDTTTCSGVKAKCPDGETQVLSVELPALPQFGDASHYCCIRKAKCSYYKYCPGGTKVVPENLCISPFHCKNNEEDQRACCENDPTTCGGLTVGCPVGYIKDPDRAGNFAGSTELEQQANCCRRRNRCGEVFFKDLACASDELLDENLISQEKEKCCVRRARCGAGFKHCPPGFKVRPKVSCAGTKCTELDEAQCCEAIEGKCGGAQIDCGTGYFQDPAKGGNDHGSGYADMTRNCCTPQMTCEAWHAEVDPHLGIATGAANAASGMLVMMLSTMVALDLLAK